MKLVLNKKGDEMKKTEKRLADLMDNVLDIMTSGSKSSGVEVS